MIRRAITLLAGALLLACSGNTTGPREQLSLSFATQASNLTVGSDVLVITKAEIVLREVELEAAETAGCDGADDAPAASPPRGPGADFDNDGEHESDDADCEEFEAGPFLLDLPLNSVMTVVSVPVPPGSYEEVEFEIHKVTGNDPADAAFFAAHPDFLGKSIRLEGTFNGVPFVFVSDLSAEQELELNPALVVTDQATTNLTVQIDLGSWFLSPTGALIDPATANPAGVNESIVKHNIRSSFRGFEDDDHDGHDDHD